MAVNKNGMTPFDLTKSEECKRILLDAREGTIKVGVYATKPGDIQIFSSSNTFDSSPPMPSQNHHDNNGIPPAGDDSWYLVGQLYCYGNICSYTVLLQSPALQF